MTNENKNNKFVFNVFFYLLQQQKEKETYKSERWV